MSDASAVFYRDSASTILFRDVCSGVARASGNIEIGEERFDVYVSVFSINGVVSYKTGCLVTTKENGIIYLEGVTPAHFYNEEIPIG